MPQCPASCEVLCETDNLGYHGWHIWSASFHLGRQSERSIAVADLRRCLHDDHQLVERHQSLWLGEARPPGIATSGGGSGLWR
jgi:hypothetical protein